MKTLLASLLLVSSLPTFAAGRVECRTQEFLNEGTSLSSDFGEDLEQGGSTSIEVTSRLDSSIVFSVTVLGEINALAAKITDERTGATAVASNDPITGGNKVWLELRRTLRDSAGEFAGMDTFALRCAVVK